MINGQMLKKGESYFGWSKNGLRTVQNTRPLKEKQIL